ncbi:CoA transferase [Thalassobaculum fulvum]|uniref:CoA transferase n=1 Tax=Thalassobaculum fulvum TaxID=1633335 RepID=A0A918XSB4_9PROT|nr:CoA transferase [Thalassobaculum fulvum]GHD52060.1 CoA transferase [Thalassobaculum fulvum]
MAARAFGPLQGMTVIELCHHMAGPTCGLMLADMGADVIKVEKIQGGDDTRRTIPPEINGESASFMMMNRNKRGVVLDLKSEAGAAALRKLVAKADVLTENFRPGVLERLGLGYEDLKKINPGLIYASISGFGLTGPYASRGGFDLVAQGMSGLMSVTGERPDGPPVKVGPPVCDITAGLLLAMGICAAYSHRLKTGEGQRLDTSLMEAGITLTYWQSAIAFATGTAPRAMGSAHPLSAPYQAVECSDGYINIAANTARFWEKMCTMIGAPELFEDPRFKTNGDRMANLKVLEAELNARFRTDTCANWLAKFEAEGIPAGPIFDILEMHRDPQTLAREMVPTVEHPKAGPVQTIGLPIKFWSTPGKVATPAPLFGQHTAEVLAELGYGESEIEAMGAAEAVHLGDNASREAAE